MIVGHTPQANGQVMDLGHLVCIDTCFGYGNLTAYEIGGKAAFCRPARACETFATFRIAETSCEREQELQELDQGIKSQGTSHKAATVGATPGLERIGLVDDIPTGHPGIKNTPRKDTVKGYQALTLIIKRNAIDTKGAAAAGNVSAIKGARWKITHPSSMHRWLPSVLKRTICVGTDVTRSSGPEAEISASGTNATRSVLG